jgi:hypothetical protein
MAAGPEQWREGLTFARGYPTNPDEPVVDAADLRVGDPIFFRVYRSGWKGEDWYPNWGFVTAVTEKSVSVDNGRRRLSRSNWRRWSVRRYVRPGASYEPDFVIH